MARILGILFALLFSLNAGATYAPGRVGTLTCSSAVFSTSGMTQLTAFAAANGGYSTFKKVGETAAATYQVPVGKTFTVYCVEIVNGNIVFDGRIGYQDTDTGYNGPTAGTNPVFFASNVVTNYANAPLLANQAVNTRVMIPYVASNPIVPAQKYLVVGWGLNTSTSISAYVTVNIWGVEQ